MCQERTWPHKFRRFGKARRLGRSQQRPRAESAVLSRTLRSECAVAECGPTATVAGPHVPRRFCAAMRPLSDREWADLHRSVQPSEPLAVFQMRVEAGDVHGLTVPQLKLVLGFCQRLDSSIRVGGLKRELVERLQHLLGPCRSGSPAKKRRRTEAAGDPPASHAPAAAPLPSVPPPSWLSKEEAAAWRGMHRDPGLGGRQSPGHAIVKVLDVAAIADDRVLAFQVDAEDYQRVPAPLTLLPAPIHPPDPKVTRRANRKKRLTVLYIVEHPNQEGDTCIDWTSQYCWTNGWNCLWRGHSIYRNRPLIPQTPNRGHVQTARSKASPRCKQPTAKVDGNSTCVSFGKAVCLDKRARGFGPRGSQERRAQELSLGLSKGQQSPRRTCRATPPPPQSGPPNHHRW